MALSLRAASGANLVAATPVSQTITLPTGTTTNDLTYFCISMANVVSAPVLSGGTGWTIQLNTDATGTSSTIIGYKTIQAGEVAPTVSWTTAARVSWVAITLQPAAGFIAQHSGYATVLTGASATTHTPNSYAAGALSGASVLLAGPRVTASLNAVALTNTPPTNWTEPTNGDQSTASGNFRQISAWTGYRLAQTGTIAPGTMAHSAASTAIIHHAFAIEVVIPGGVAVRSSSKVALTTASPLNLPVPAGTTAGDFMVCVIFAENLTVAPTASVTGFTQVGGWVSTAATGAQPVMGIFTKTAGGSEGTNYSAIGNISTGSYAYVCMAITGSANAIEVALTGSSATTAATALVAPTVSPTNAASLLICGFTQDSGGAVTYSTPASMTLVQSFTTATTEYCRGLVASQVLSASGATGTRTSTASFNSLWSAGSFTIAPAAGVASALPQPVTNINQVALHRSHTW